MGSKTARSGRARWWPWSLWAVVLLAWTGQARAAGVRFDEHHAQAMGMAGAVTALMDRPAAIFFNPAGLAALEGFQVETGVTFVTPQATFTGQPPDHGGSSSLETADNYFFLPNLHAAYRLHDRLSVGLGIYLPYGLSMEWPTTVTVDGQRRAFWGRGIVERFRLQTLHIATGAAVKLHDRVSLGATVTLVRGAFGSRWRVALADDPRDDVAVTLDGDDVAVSASAGLLIQVIPDLLRFGFTFRGGPSLSFEGEAVFSRERAPDPPTAGPALPPKTAFSAAVELPHVFSFGLATTPLATLQLGLAVDLATWNRYASLDLDVAGHPELSGPQAKRWETTAAVHLGGQVRLLSRLLARAGVSFEQGAPPSSTISLDLPVGDRYAVALGVGYALSGLTIDAAYQYWITPEVHTTDDNPLAGRYRFSAHLVGVSLGYDFGR